MKYFKYLFLFFVIFFSAGCNQISSKDLYTNYANRFHLNFNSGDYKANYDWILKYSKMNTSLDQYTTDFEYIKLKMGNFKELKIKNINYEQITAAGEKLIQVSFESKFEKGDAREFFYFGEKNQFYRYELFSKNLLQ